MVNPGVKVWYCRYANAKDYTTNRTTFFLPYADHSFGTSETCVKGIQCKQFI
jgi:hypothetical protein